MTDTNMSNKVRYLVLITVSLISHVSGAFDEPPKQGLLNEIEKKKENPIRIDCSESRGKVSTGFHHCHSENPTREFHLTPGSFRFTALHQR